MPKEYNRETLIKEWEEFFETRGYRAQIHEKALGYPDERSVFVDFSDLDRHSPDLAEHLLDRPSFSIECGEFAVRNLIPPDQLGVELHLRVKSLPLDKSVRVEIPSALAART